MGADELAGMACEEAIESRLVYEHGPQRPWQVEHGPFEPERLAQLPSEGWSLLVQGVDRWVPRLGQRLDDFRFIPDWRIDDIMVSFAPRGAGIGAHLDHYDVFLIQGKGRRQWRITLAPMAADSEIIPDIDLKVLKQFDPDLEIVLEPGDALYLPPLYGHHGVSLEDALTFSVGFRAPRYADLCREFADYCASQLEEDAFYEDPDLSIQDNPAIVSEAAIERLRQPWLSLLNDRHLFRRWLASYLTEPKNTNDVDDVHEEVSWADLEELDAASLLFRREGRRFAWIPPAQDLVGVFAVEGQTWSLSGQPQIDFATCLSQKTSWLWSELQDLAGDPLARQILLALVNRQQILVGLWQEWE